MGFSMFSGQSSPIAIDFGSSSVKLLQIEPGGPPKLQAAVGLRVPDSIRHEKDLQLQFLENQLPRMLRKGRFKGRRAICSVPSADTFVQHMQIAGAEGIDRDDLIKTQLQAQLGWPLHGMVIRTFEVANVHREGDSLTEVICVAIGRETVMRYVQLLKKCRLETVGVHSEIVAMVQAFKHLQTSPEDAGLVTMYIDLGWACTNVAIAHGDQIRFARCIQVGGQQFDQRIADRLGCDAASARAHRISEQVLATADQGSGSTGSAAGRADAATDVLNGDGSDGNEAGMDSDLSDFADSVADELSMCVRYHQSLFRDRRIGRMIFMGGEARNIGLCQQVAKALRLPAQLGDPLTRFESRRSLRTPGLSLGQPQPGWAVACGLCTAPTDL
ncbi:MAG: pilus assembly protein PilM [Planctomycetota bacterium]|jgi:type IV pilus assembly protein PilM